MINTSIDRLINKLKTILFFFLIILLFCSCVNSKDIITVELSISEYETDAASVLFLEIINNTNDSIIIPGYKFYSGIVYPTGLSLYSKNQSDFSLILLTGIADKSFITIPANSNYRVPFVSPYALVVETLPLSIYAEIDLNDILTEEEKLGYSSVIISGTYSSEEFYISREAGEKLLYLPLILNSTIIIN